MPSPVLALWGSALISSSYLSSSLAARCSRPAISVDDGGIRLGCLIMQKGADDRFLDEIDYRKIVGVEDVTMHVDDLGRYICRLTRRQLWVSQSRENKRATACKEIAP